jgi:UMP-CMP kinase family protein
VDRIDISNWRRIGFPEYELVNDMIACANFMAEEEDKIPDDEEEPVEPPIPPVEDTKPKISAPALASGGGGGVGGGRSTPASASDGDREIINYLKEKVDPLFVPLMRKLVQHRPDDVIGFCTDYLKAQEKKIIFVLGGPGSGKGTQCSKIADQFDCLHLSAGDLLRQEVASGSHMAELINGYIREGQIVPSHITIQLIKKAIFSASHKKVLVDGFPRAMDQAHEFTQVTGVECEFCLFFDCPEDILVDRLLERGKTSGRADDNMHSIEKRFVTFKETSMPVVEHFDRKGILKRIDSSHPHPDLVFEEVKKIFHAHL